MLPQTTKSRKSYFTWKQVTLFSVLALVAGLIIWQQPAAVAQTSSGASSVQDRPLTSLRDLNNAFVDIAALVKPTVVTVSTERIVSVTGGSPFGAPHAGDLFEFFFGPGQGGRQQPSQPNREYIQEGLGSGVIVGADGKILTNNHVIAEADSIFVRTFDGQRYRAEIIGTDPETDIAVLQIDADDLEFITLGDSDALRVGEMVLAIGSPMSASLAYSVSQGIVSAKGRSNVGLASYEDFIQTDAAINPGNSGGPLVNLDGELVGLNSAIVSRSGGFQGIGFSVPSNMARQIMNSLIADGRVTRGWLGVSIQDVSEPIASAMGLEDTHGALVGDVLPDSPAERGGLEAGDIIVAMDSKEVENSTQFRINVADEKPGTEVRLTVMRDDDDLDISVELGERPSDRTVASTDTESVEQLVGFSVATLTRELADRFGLDRSLRGVVVTAITPATEAYRAGLREGDVIRSVDRRRIQDANEFNQALEGKQSGDNVLLRVIRQGNGFYIAFSL